MAIKKVSCVLATSRPAFVEHALALFSALDWPNKELVLVEDVGSEYKTTKRFSRSVPSGTVRKSVKPGTLLGIKFGLGVSLATGDAIWKFDDDDYYAPGFLTRAVSELDKGVDLCWWGKHQLYFAKTGVTRMVNNSRLRAGGSFVFTRELSQRVGFRPLPHGIDTGFELDARSAKPPARLSAIMDSPSLFIYVRHGQNMWQTSTAIVGGLPKQIDTDSILVSQTEFYPGPCGIPDKDRQFYQAMSNGNGSGNGGVEVSNGV
jgi:hypothetical protein